jgi:Tfp pilus assembly protein PilN
MDWKREIKLSDLFKRRPKEPDAEPVASEPVAEPTGERKSLLKRDLSELFKRREKPPREPKPAVDEGAARTSFLKRGVSVRRRRGEPAEPTGEPKPPKQSRRRVKPAPVPDVPLMRAFNLLPKEDAREAGRRPSTAQLALAVLGLVLIAGLASLFLITNARVADKEREYNELRDQLAARAVPAEEPRPEGEGDDAALVQERQTRTTALATALGHRIAWDRVLRDFSLILPEDVWLKTLKAASAPPPNATPAEGAPPADASAAATAKNTFEINGYARDQEAIAELLTRLAVLPEIETAQLVSATKVELEGESVLDFTVTAVVKPRQPGDNA